MPTKFTTHQTEVESIMAQDTTFFSLTTLQCVPGGTAAVLAGIENLLTRSRSPSLLGCWISEIGLLNEIVLLRGFESLQSMNADPLGRAELRQFPDAADGLVSVDQGIFRGFPGLPILDRGRLGRYYEIRTYQLRPAPDSLTETIAAWQAAVPERVTLSPLVVVMHALEGPGRIVHIWPFETLDQRQAVRAEAFEKSLWPPRGSLKWLESAKSSIYIPAPFSPLQ
jgi:hypothetical protein